MKNNDQEPAQAPAEQGDEDSARKKLCPYFTSQNVLYSEIRRVKLMNLLKFS